MVVDAPLEQLLETLEDIEITYDYDQTYAELCNAITDYCNETQDWDLDDLLYPDDDGIISYDEAEEMAKRELDDGGLVRLYYFLGTCNFDAENLFYLNAYGNLQSVGKDDLENFKQTLIDAVAEKLDEEV